MRKQFLVGNFLRAYAGSYRYPARYGRSDEKADAAWLEDRFVHRAQRSRERKSAYVVGIQVAAVAVLLTLLGVARLDLQGGDSSGLTASEQETVDLQDIVQTAQETLPPPPPRPQVPIVVADDEILEYEALDLDATLDFTEAVAVAPPPPSSADGDEEAYVREVFVVVEEQPEMIGGVAELAKDVTYPRVARQAGIEGMVVIKIVVTADGLPSEPTVLRSPADILNQAAIDAVMKQRFKPGRQRGRAVAVEMAIPVRFRLT